MENRQCSCLKTPVLYLGHRLPNTPLSRFSEAWPRCVLVLSAQLSSSCCLRLDVSQDFATVGGSSDVSSFVFVFPRDSLQSSRAVVIHRTGGHANDEVRNRKPLAVRKLKSLNRERFLNLSKLELGCVLRLQATPLNRVEACTRGSRSPKAIPLSSAF